MATRNKNKIPGIFLSGNSIKENSAGTANSFQIPIRSGKHGHVSTSSYELLSDPWVNKLQFTIYKKFTKIYSQ